MKNPIIFLLFNLIAVFNVAQTPQLGIPFGHTEDIWGTHFTQEGKYLMSYSSNKIKSWELGSGRLLENSKTFADGQLLRFVRVSPDARYVSYLWDEDGVEKTGLWDVRRDIYLEDPDYNEVIASFSSDKRWGVDFAGNLLDLSSGKVVAKTPSFAPDGFLPQGLYYQKRG